MRSSGDTMTKNLLLDAFRMIKRTKTKFITLFAIVALGVSFFIGISSISPIMSYSVDEYNDQYNLMDIEVYSNYGFNEDDLFALSNTEGVTIAQGRKFVDAILFSEDTNYVARIIGYPKDNQVNQLKLVEGRLPENENECVVGIPKLFLPQYDVGDIARFGHYKEDLTEIIKNTEMEVVGVVETPEFLHGNNGISTLNKQFIVYYVFTQEENFKVDYYSSALLVVEKMKEYNSFSQEYKVAMEEFTEKVETLGKTQAIKRKDEIEDEAIKEYEDALAEYEEEKKDAEEELASAEKELQDGRLELDKISQDIKDGKISLEEAKVQLSEQYEKGLEELNLAQGQIDIGYKELQSAENEFFNTTKPNLIIQKEELEAQLTPLLTAQQGLNDIDSQVNQLNENKIQLEIRKAELENMATLTPEETAELDQINQELIGIEGALLTLSQQKQSILDTLQSQGISSQDMLNATIHQLQQGILAIENGIEEGENELALSRIKLDEAAKQVEVGYIQLDWEIEQAKNQMDEKWQELIDGEVELGDAESELQEGLEEYETAKKEAEEKFAEAEEKLEEAKKEIEDLEDGEWMVLDRSMHYSSQTYKDTILQMKQISRLFPLFFILVAALVCSTTMTRMIDEQRGQIGTLRSLGYSKIACTSKYLLYALCATLGGSIVGIIAGLSIFPPVIYDAWGMMYHLPAMKFTISFPMIFTTVFSFFIIMITVTWMAARKEMQEVTSQLLRPKPPALGKRIFLEYIPFIWNRLSFTSKVTVRNIFRYKKRFFMTVLGIGGCTALLVAAFGLRGSIGKIAHREFGELYGYDGFIQLEKDLTPLQRDEALNAIINDDSIEKIEIAGSYSAVVQSDEKEENVTVTVFEDDQSMKEIRDVVNRKTKESYDLPENSVLINEKLAILFKLSEGDSLWLEGENGKKMEVEVAGIFESYAYHNLYISQSYYEKLYGEELPQNSVFIKLKGDLETKNLVYIESLNLFEPIISGFEDMIQGMDIVIYILIVSAGLLAFIVLGNLTSVNISERQREIATLKVLGFNRKEVNSYIFKENLLLVSFGILLGFGLGAILHQYVIVLIEMDFVMFGRSINTEGYILSGILTFIFAIVVNYIVSFSLRKIKMIESLKSVE